MTRGVKGSGTSTGTTRVATPRQVAPTKPVIKISSVKTPSAKVTPAVKGDPKVNTSTIPGAKSAVTPIAQKKVPSSTSKSTAYKMGNAMGSTKNALNSLM